MSEPERILIDGSPLAEGPPPRFPIPASVDASDHPIRVLHVEDEADLGDLVKSYLESAIERLSVVTEPDAEAALDRLADEEFDCIVSDYDMPGMSGIELLRTVREDAPTLPFILYTGKGSEEVASEAIAAGVTDYMQKEVGTDQYEVLANRIVNAVERHRTEQKLLGTLEGYRRLVEQDLVGIYVIQDEAFVFVNEKIADLTGYSRGELVGRSVLEVVSGEDRDLVRQNLRKRQSGEIESLEYSVAVKRKDGSVFDARVQGGTVDIDGERAIMGVLIEEAE